MDGSSLSVLSIITEYQRAFLACHITHQSSLEASGRRQVLRCFLRLQYNDKLIADVFPPKVISLSSSLINPELEISSVKHSGFCLELGISPEATGSPEILEILRNP